MRYRLIVIQRRYKYDKEPKQAYDIESDEPFGAFAAEQIVSWSDQDIAPMKQLRIKTVEHRLEGGADDFTHVITLDTEEELTDEGRAEAYRRLAANPPTVRISYSGERRNLLGSV